MSEGRNASKSVFSRFFGKDAPLAQSPPAAFSPTKRFSPPPPPPVTFAAPNSLKVAEQSVVNNQRFVIIILVGILAVSLLGSQTTAYFFNTVFTGILSFISHMLSTFGYSAGTLLNSTANIASNATINSIEVADGAVSSVGDIFRRANQDGTYPQIKHDMDEVLHTSQKPFLPRAVNDDRPPPPPAAAAVSDDPHIKQMRDDLDRVINESSSKKKQAEEEKKEEQQKPVAKSDDATLSSIQKPITASKTSFCYLGMFEGTRGCIQLESGDVCQYGTLYDSREQCLALGK